MMRDRVEPPPPKSEDASSPAASQPDSQAAPPTSSPSLLPPWRCTLCHHPAQHQPCPLVWVGNRMPESLSQQPPVVAAEKAARKEVPLACSKQVESVSQRTFFVSPQSSVPLEEREELAERKFCSANLHDSQKTPIKTCRDTYANAKQPCGTIYTFRTTSTKKRRGTMNRKRLGTLF